MATKRRRGGGPRGGSAASGGGRPARVGELIRQELASMLSDGTIKEPRLERAMATVTEVRVSPDLQVARAFVSIFSDEAEIRAEVLAGLEAAKSQIRRILGGRMRLRFTPDLLFHDDRSIQTGARIEAVLRELREEAAERIADVEPEAEGEGAPAEDAVGAADQADPGGAADEAPGR